MEHVQAEQTHLEPKIKMLPIILINRYSYIRIRGHRRLEKKGHEIRRDYTMPKKAGGHGIPCMIYHVPGSYDYELCYRN